MLRWFCPPDLLEEIEGDLIERFHRDLDKETTATPEVVRVRRARRRLLWNTLRYCRPGIVFRNHFSIHLNDFVMVANYLKVAVRVMGRNKGYAALNILGLAVGLVGAMLLFLWVSHEFSYDQFHANKERTYMAWNKKRIEGELRCTSSTPRPLAAAIANDFAAVESAVSFAQYSDTYLLKTDEARLKIDRVTLTDPAFLTMFSFPFVRGSANDAMKEPSSIVITEAFAHKLFGTRDALGETVTFAMSGMDFSFTVTGVLQDLPSNTDFDFDFLIPFHFLESLGEKDENWNNHSLSTFVLLDEGAELTAVNKNLAHIRKNYAGPNDDTEVFLYPYVDNHLYGRFENGVPAGGRIEVVRMLGLLGVLLLAIACINFINLSTARSQRRAREVGVRKVTGALRRSLILQFLCESVLVAWGAAVISFLAVILILPFFNRLVGQDLTVNVGDPAFWGVVVAGVTVVGIVAGMYPAFFLSSFRPLRVLKGETVLGAGAGFLRSSLVFLQFGFVVTLVVSALVVQHQIRFLQDREPGYNREHLIYHPITGTIREKYQAYRNALLESGLARSVTKTSSPITERMSATTELSWNGKDPGFKAVVERFHVDEDISTTAGLTIVEGRDLDLEKYPADSTAVLLNETAVRLMNFDHPVGEVIEDYGHTWRVVGVVKDFVLTSPMQRIEPMVLMGAKHDWVFNAIHIRLSPLSDITRTMDRLSDIHARFSPDFPPDFHFVDAEYEAKFLGVRRTLLLTRIFTGMAVCIACMGLLGLSTYMVESRVKEIGIRKVMGGSMANIIGLLSIRSLKPILISVLVFSPLAWLAMRWWLNFFAYRTTLDAWTFVLTAVFIISLALCTMGFQVIRAARANPVESLRAE